MLDVCCPSKPLAKDVLDLTDAFNFLQYVSGPTQEHGHTLDLVLSYGLPIFNIKVYDVVFSDHMPVLFDVTLPCHNVKSHSPVRHCPVLKPSTAAQFSSAFINVAQPDTWSSIHLDTEQVTSSFLSTCASILDFVAPLKAMRPKSKSDPWLNDIIRAARHECRRAERRWRKDKLHVSYEILKQSWRKYQRTVKTKKTWHFSDIIFQNFNKPCVLFKTIDLLLNCPQSTCLQASSEVCENFLCYFIDKDTTIRAHISSPSFDPSIVVTSSAVLNQLEPVSFQSLTKIVTSLKLSSCPTDIIPTRLFKVLGDHWTEYPKNCK